MNIQTIKTKIEDLEKRKTPHIFSIEIAQAKIQTITDQIRILEEVMAIPLTPRRRLERGPKVSKGRNDSAMLKIFATATSPLTSIDIQKLWPADLKPQSVYPTLNALTKRRKVTRTRVIRNGKKPCYAYTLRDVVFKDKTRTQEEVEFV